MIADSTFIHTAHRSRMVNKPLKRGRACMNCRFLKIKCDGTKPICGPCRKSPKDDECEYSDGPTRSRTKALEDTVSRLEARLHELENPEDYTPSVKLFDPYSQFNSPPTHTALSISPPPTAPANYGSLPNSPYNHVPQLLVTTTPSSTPESIPSYLPLTPASTTYAPSPLGIFDSQLPGRSPDFTASSLDYAPLIDNTLIRKFLDHASEFGFFLDSERLMQSNRFSDSRPSPALLFAMHLWGAHLSSDTNAEEHFKHNALQSAATDLTAHAFLHTLQAEVLLSYYFFRTGTFLEARAHTATAFALALGAGLHQIRSVRGNEAQTHVDAATGRGVLLPPPRDAVEEGERINAFWAVFVLQKNLSMALEPTAEGVGVGSVFEATGPGALQIDTPWPMELDDYKRGLLATDFQSDATVYNYLQTPPGSQQYSNGYRPSLIAQNVKACILLHRAVYISAQWKPSVSQRNAQSLLSASNSVDGLICELRAQLPSVTQLSLGVDAARTRSRTRMLLLTHSLLNAATIKLHGTFMASDPVSRERWLEAARDMFRFGGMELQGLGYLNPMMGTLWTTAYGVFVSELHRINANVGWPTAASEKEALDAHENLQDGIRALSMFANQSLLMRYELTKAQEAYGST